jgi:NitT/TauT family transport system permease protein
MSFSPFAVILQVTPIVSIAPLIFIYIESRMVGLLLCAWIVAFFPILSNTTLGLQSVDRNLLELFDLYGSARPKWAPRWLGSFIARVKALYYLRGPAALPYFLGGLKIAGGLALIGAVVAEIAAGSAGAGSGLAYRIIESQFRLNIPRLFAALVLLSLTGVIIFLAMSAFSHMLLRRWHESAISQEK